MVATSLFLLTIAFQFPSDGPIVPRLRPDAPPVADLRVDVPLALIPVHVTTGLGASVTSLQKENFRIFEDGVEQKITNFSSEDAPLSIGLLFDASDDGGWWQLAGKRRPNIDAW